MRGSRSGALKLAILSIIALISISSASILIKATESPPSVVSFWRLFLSVSILTLYAASTGRLGSVARAMIKGLHLTILSGFLLAIHFYSWIWSLRILPVLVSTTLVDLHPIFTGIVSHIALKEKLRESQWVFIAISLVGALLTPYKGFETSDSQWALGSVLALIGALAASGYFVIGRVVRINSGLYEYVIPTYFWSSLLLAIISILEGNHPLSNIDLRELSLFMAIALGPMIGGHTVLNYLLRYLEAPIVSTIAVLEPVGAGLLAYLFFGESVHAINIMGMAIAIAGMVLLGLARGDRFR